MKLLLTIAALGLMLFPSSSNAQCNHNCGPTVQANEVFTLAKYENCQPNYTQEFICVFERGANFWMRDGAEISHNTIDKINASWILPESSHFIQGTGWLKVFLVDANAYTIHQDHAMAKVMNQLNYRTVSTYNLNNSVLFDQEVFNRGKTECDKLAKQYIDASSNLNK